MGGKEQKNVGDMKQSNKEKVRKRNKGRRSKIVEIERVREGEPVGEGKENKGEGGMKGKKT